MAAYAALTSILQILDQLEHHPFPPISLHKQQVDSLTEIATFLQKFLEGYDSPFVDSDEADPLEMRIADAAYAAEDVIELYIVDNISSRGSASADIPTRDLQKVIKKMGSIKKMAMKMMRKKSSTPIQAHHQLERNILRSSPFSGKNSSMMVGFDDVLRQLLYKLTRGPSRDLQVIPITGMGGIGKTTLARNIFQHPLIEHHFDICAWVTISQQYETKEILSQILYQASGKSSEKSEVELGYELHEYLYGRRYLIIMDDIWSIEVCKNIKFFFPDCNNGSRVVVTTRQSFLTSQLTKDSDDVFHMKFLDEVNSCKLLSKIVFGEEGFPLQLEKIGKKIVEKCRGLPLSIVVIGSLLARSQHTHELWAHIAHELNSIVNLENDEYCLKLLKLSYNLLPDCLKPCFLYMGIFEEDKRIRVSTLIKLWVSEGFLKPKNGKSLETIGEGFLKDLIDRNLILVDELGKTGNIKYCKMHNLLRNFCLKEAGKERFYHVIGQHGARGIQKHKRMVCDPNCSSKRVLDALKSTRSHVRSFIDQSKYDTVGLLPKFRLLRILQAGESSRVHLEDVFYKLVNSRYVAIRYEDPLRSIKISSSVTFLWNIHTLRISYLNGLIIAPVEIWKMSQLRHVELEHGGYIYLPDPPSGSSSVILENLQTLKGIRNFKCGEEMVKRIPNIKKLRIDYKETRRHDGDDYCLSNLHSLHKLESLTIMLEKDVDLLHNITFPQSLIKLSLDLRYGTRVGWEEMVEKIGGSLPLLQKLKLFNGVFKTGKWETVEGQFPNLKFLELSYCHGLKQLMIEESSHFPCLEQLHLFGLEELKKIPLEIGEMLTLKSIELRYCSKSAVKSAKKIVDEQEELQGGEEHLPFLVRVVEWKFKQEALQSLASPNFQFEWTD